jgi:tripartite-type tricarboxylate transporter receptor subunit TctC
VPLWSELEQICWAVQDYDGFVTGKASGFKTSADMVAWVKANPGKLQFGTLGPRTKNRVLAMAITDGLGIRDLVTLVPYDGGSQIRTAVLGNHVQIATCAMGDVRAIIESGDCLPLGMFSSERSSLLPNVPTTKELGVDLNYPTPRGFFAPKGMAKAKRDYLSGVFKAALSKPECVAELNKMFIDAKYVDPEAGRAGIIRFHDGLKALFEKYKE